MCGICGFYGDFDQRDLDAMSSSIAHRGPDACGSYYCPQDSLGLGHRRLSIIDLSERGTQPLWDVDRRAVVTFNGEIYNYRSLRQDLVSSGYRFHSESDTEVLLNLYLKYGTSMLNLLDGMFAFAIWEPSKKRLLLARDRAGIKPLYFVHTARGFLFASELKALLTSSAVSRDLSAPALLNYLLYQWSPGEKTPLQNVKKLPAGTFLTLGPQGQSPPQSFWSIPITDRQKNVDPREAAQQLRYEIEQSVRAQLVSDAPVGFFLSGGVDSSAIATLAASSAPEGPLDCYTVSAPLITAETSNDGRLDDLPFATRMADRLGANLHRYETSPMAVDSLERAIWHMDEPQADFAPLNVLILCEAAREHGKKVLLSGAGADDILTGYRRHLPLPTLERIRGLLPYLAGPFNSLARGLSRQTAARRRIGKLAECLRPTPEGTLASLFEVTARAEITSVMSASLLAEARDNWGQELFEALKALQPKPALVDQCLYLESMFFLPDHNLNYTDKLSMAAGVEVRVPFLSNAVLDLCWSLPPALKIKGGTTKWILKQSLKDVLPAEILDRPKTGFGVPVRDWVRHSLSEYIADTFASQAFRERGLFDPRQTRSLIDRNREGAVDGSLLLLSILAVETWCRLFLDPPSKSEDIRNQSQVNLTDHPECTREHGAGHGAHHLH